MANPFSGLENIGQSYLQGVQLANQRQAREDAIAQRQEEARIRQDYYNQLGQERQAALQERIKARLDAAMGQFGQDLVLANGEPDYAASALKRDRRLQEEQLASAEGELGALYGTQAPLSPEIIGSPAYQTGRLRGTAKRLAQEKDLTAAMIRRGFIPADQEQDRELPDEVRNQIEDISTSDIFSGEVPVTAAPTRAGAPMGGGQRVSFGGRQYFAPTPTAKRAEKGGTVKFTGPSGQEFSVNITQEQANQLLAKQLASPDKEPDPFGDIDEAEKELKRLASRGKNVDVNVYEDDLGNVKVRKDQTGIIGESYGYTIDEAKAQLEVKRKDRMEALGITSSEPAPKNRAEAASRARRVTPSSALRNVPPITQRVPGAASTNAPVVTAPRMAVNSLQPAITDSSESLSELDPEELRQAMIEAQSRGVDPAVLGLQLRQALNQAGVPTAAGTNSLPLGLSQEQFDAILSLPRGRAPVEL